MAIYALTSGNDNFLGGVEADVFEGEGGGMDWLDGGAGGDRFVITNAGVYQINGGDGADVLQAGPNIDLRAHQISNVEVLDVEAPGTTTIVTLAQLQNFSSVRSSAYSSAAITLGLVDTNALLDLSTLIGAGHSAVVYSYSDESLNLKGTLQGDTLAGSSVADQLDGGEGGDQIDGGGGDDLLYGGGGSDFLNGGTGVNYLAGGDGADTFEVGSTVFVNDFDTALGQAGDDLFLLHFGGSGAIDGGSGRDRVRVDNVSSLGTFSFTDVEVLEVDSYVSSSLLQLKSFLSIEVTSIRATLKLEGNGGSLDLISKLSLETSIDVDASDLTSAVFIVGGGSDDSFVGTEYADSILGQAGDDYLFGGLGGDLLAGGLGDDTYFVDNVDDVVVEDANAGIDHVFSEVSFRLGSYVELLTLTGFGAVNGYGNGLKNVIIGNLSNNELLGGANIDRIEGGGGADVIDGGAGIDAAVYSQSESGVSIDLLVGSGSGGDAEGDTLIAIENLEGSGFDDALSGNELKNIIRGIDGDDTILGRGNNDWLCGGVGTDIIDGGSGRDILWGGDGKSADFLCDTFRFNRLSDSVALVGGRDWIRDFEVEIDKIDVSGIDARTNLGGNQAFNFIGTREFTAVAGQLRFTTFSNKTLVEGDVNGDGKADFSIGLTGLHTLKAFDFVL